MQKGRGCRLRSEYQLFVRDDPRSPAAEAIRSLRTNLQFVGLDRSLRSVMVTSAGPSEGKTSIASNLAASLAESGIKTIVVGVDLRKPALHRVFERSNRIGLTNLLLGQTSLEDALQETDVPNLRLLAAGPIPPNPAEMLGTEAMRAVHEKLVAAAEMVVYDSTPIAAVTDAVVLSRIVDGVIFVVAVRQTPRELVRKAKEQLEQVRANILGVVANRVEVRGSEGYYYYYYGDNEAAATGTGRASSRTRPVLGRVLARLLGRS